MRRRTLLAPPRPNRALSVLALAALALSVSAQQPEPAQEPLPRFRAGTNLVRLDAYVTANGQPVTDLTAEDFELFEDDQPQKVENFEVVRARDAGADTTAAPNPSSTRDQRDAAQDPDARVFVLFLDTWHVGLDGSARSAAPVAAFLDKVVGPGDLVGVMTPDITPQNITLTRRGSGIDQVLRDVWTWGQRDRANTVDPREQDIAICYPDTGSTTGIAQEMIERRREQKTLRALDSMVRYLDDLREERKFVVLLSEGWILFRQNDQLARPLGGSPPGGAQPVGVGVDGRVSTRPDPREGGSGAGTLDSCERERVMLSYIDHSLEIRQLAQRANRANVSFYPLDPRGLVVFDSDIGGPFRPPPPQVDRQRLVNRQDGLRELAEQTDGAPVLNTNDTDGALVRLLADTSTYYLLSYYSTNTKLDGRFRRISVRVKRPDVEVRARPGYLAPTEAEARAAGAAVGGPGAPGTRRVLPPAVSRALDAIVPGRGNLPVRVQAAGLADRVRAVVELDAATMKQPAWQAGGTLQVTIEPERGTAPTVLDATISPGQRSIVVEGPEDGLAPGRYTIRVEGRASNGQDTIRATTQAVVPGENQSISASTVAYRRGPTTGLAYQPTADPRFRRTERLRVEVPVFVAGALTTNGRVLTREGQPLQLQVATSERTDERSHARYVVADVTLAPLAQGDFVLEVTVGKESATYGFRIVP
jgi:VWFA-related protein